MKMSDMHNVILIMMCRVWLTLVMVERAKLLSQSCLPLAMIYSLWVSVSNDGIVWVLRLWCVSWVSSILEDPFTFLRGFCCYRFTFLRLDAPSDISLPRPCGVLSLSRAVSYIAPEPRGNLICVPLGYVGGRVPLSSWPPLASWCWQSRERLTLLFSSLSNKPKCLSSTGPCCWRSGLPPPSGWLRSERRRVLQREYTWSISIRREIQSTLQKFLKRHRKD